MFSWLATIFFAGFLLLLQVSFVPFLPGYLAFLPLSFVVGIYLFQHQARRAGIGLIVLTGLAVDLTHGSIFFFETIWYSLAALAVYFVSRQWFTNRSFLGVLGCVVIGWLVLLAGHLLPTTVLWWRDASQIDWPGFFQEASVGLILALLLLIGLFPLARLLRVFFKWFFFLR